MKEKCKKTQKKPSTFVIMFHKHSRASLMQLNLLSETFLIADMNRFYNNYVINICPRQL